MLTALAAVLVAQVDLNRRDVIARVGQGPLHDIRDPCAQRFVMLDIVVGVDLNAPDRSGANPQPTLRPLMSWKTTMMTAITSRAWIKPPAVIEVTRPRAQRTKSTTAMV